MRQKWMEIKIWYHTWMGPIINPGVSISILKNKLMRTRQVSVSRVTEGIVTQVDRETDVI